LSDFDKHGKLPNVMIELTGRSAYHRPVARSNATPRSVRRCCQEARPVYIK
jgi:hypothetical protein